MNRPKLMRRPALSPLRYPGGKGSLSPFLEQVLRLNGLIEGRYVEPYAGGAGAALALLLTGRVKDIVINDLDPAIHAFWKAVTTDPKTFAQRIASAELTVKEWRHQKRIYMEGNRDDFKSLGFATFYLNRTNRSGVLNGGPIGGIEQNGPDKIDARFNKKALIERIRLVGLYANHIEVRNDDGAAVIREFADTASTLIYADPPYTEKAGSLYLNAFTPDDHRSLASLLNSLSNTCWLLTYDDTPQIEDLYAKRRRQRFSLHYSAYRVGKVNEMMIFSDAMDVPTS